MRQNQMAGGRHFVGCPHGNLKYLPSFSCFSVNMELTFSRIFYLRIFCHLRLGIGGNLLPALCNALGCLGCRMVPHNDFAGTDCDNFALQNTLDCMD